MRWAVPRTARHNLPRKPPAPVASVGAGSGTGGVGGRSSCCNSGLVRTSTTACCTPPVTASFTAEATASLRPSLRPSKMLSRRSIWSARFFRGGFVFVSVMGGSLRIEIELVGSVSTKSLLAPPFETRGQLAVRRGVEMLVAGAGRVGQGLDREAVQAPGHGRQHVLGPLVAAQPPAAAGGAGRVVGEGGDEGQNVFAAADETDIPLPGQAAHLGQQL